MFVRATIFPSRLAGMNRDASMAAAALEQNTGWLHDGNMMLGLPRVSKLNLTTQYPGIPNCAACFGKTGTGGFSG
nr:hypothetical protein [Hyphomonas sediminis]